MADRVVTSYAVGQARAPTATQRVLHAPCKTLLPVSLHRPTVNRRNPRRAYSACGPFTPGAGRPRVLGFGVAEAEEIMKKSSDPTPSASNYLNDLFTLRESLKKDLAEGNTYLQQSLQVQDVGAAINRALLPLLAPADADRQDADEIHRIENEAMSPSQAQEQGPVETAESTLDLIEFTERHLTDLEFLAVALALAAQRAKMRRPYEKLAQRFHIQKATLIEAFASGMEKINAHWRERRSRPSVKSAA